MNYWLFIHLSFLCDSSSLYDWLKALYQLRIIIWEQLTSISFHLVVIVLFITMPHNNVFGVLLQQDETDKRHKEKLEAIQEKAFCMSILRHSTEDHNDAPKLVPYEKKKICTICNVMVSRQSYSCTLTIKIQHTRSSSRDMFISVQTGSHMPIPEIWLSVF